MSANPILVVHSTNRPNARSHVVATYYETLLRQAHIPTAMLTLGNLPNDFTARALYHNKGKHAGFNALTKKMDAFHKYVFVVPEYNGSFPGVLKAFIDGYAIPQVFRNKKAALVGVGKGRRGNIMGLSHLSDIFQYLGMALYPMQAKLANIPDITLENFSQYSTYTSLLAEQVQGFITF